MPGVSTSLFVKCRPLQIQHVASIQYPTRNYAVQQINLSHGKIITLKSVKAYDPKWMIPNGKCSSGRKSHYIAFPTFGFKIQNGLMSMLLWKTASRQRRTLLVCVCKFWWVCTPAAEASEHGNICHATVSTHIGFWHGNARNYADTASIIKLQTQLSLREDRDSLNLSPDSLGRNGPEEPCSSRNGDYNKAGVDHSPWESNTLLKTKNFWSSLSE